MLKTFGLLIAKELGTVHGHAPLFLQQLCELSPPAKRIVMPYLRWRMGRMDSVDIQIMLESDLVSVEDLDFFAAELG